MIIITFDQDINTSVQVGDIAYYCPVATNGGFDTAAQTDIVQIGVISSVDNGSHRIECDNITGAEPSDGSFILFSKNNAVNMSSPTGYYANVKFVNDSTIKSEMFAATCDIFESSK